MVVTTNLKREKPVHFCTRGSYRHVPQVYKVPWHLRGVTSIVLSHPLARVLDRTLMFFRGCPGLVLHKRRAKYGGDWLMRRVNLDKISTIQLRI